MDLGMTAPTSKEKAALRNTAQKLKPAIHIGKKGITPALLAEFTKALKLDQLVKVAFKANRDEISSFVGELESKTDSHCVGGVGKRRSFYKVKE